MSRTAIRVLWLTGEYHQPADMGMYIYSAALLAGAEAAGNFDIRLVAHQRPGSTPDLPADGRWHLVTTPTPPRFHGLLETRPHMVAEVADGAWRAAVAHEMAVHRPQAVVFDHLRTGGALDLVPHDVGVVYLAQNHETAWKRAAAHEHPMFNPRRWVLTWDLARLRRLENRMLSRAQQVTAITDLDRQTMQPQRPARLDPIEIMPPPLPERSRSPRPHARGSRRRATIVTTLEWSVKQADTAALLDVAAPALAEAGIELSVVARGFVPPGWSERYPTVIFEGFVDDLDSYLRDSRLGLLYEPGGGGFKIKTLDFVLAGVPIVAHSLAVRGTGLEPGADYLEGPTPEAMVRHCEAAIDNLDQLDKLARSAAERILERFEPGRIGASLATLLERAAHGR
ncbi:MAG: glycosyltransferase family 4 protein [Actinomycetia bacterium]|nr:glycosyltransferase family 4 protein [Actinomycetes bacterium]